MCLLGYDKYFFLYRNTYCAASPPPKTITTPTTSSVTRTSPRIIYHQINPLECSAVGLTCVRCDDLCGSAGWCVLNTDLKPRCLCDYGWTGSQAIYITKATEDAVLSRNRIRAFDCKRWCPYHPYERYLLAVKVFIIIIIIIINRVKGFKIPQLKGSLEGRVLHKRERVATLLGTLLGVQNYKKLTFAGRDNSGFCSSGG